LIVGHRYLLYGFSFASSRLVLTNKRLQKQPVKKQKGEKMRIQSYKALYYRPATGFKISELRQWQMTIFGTDMIVTKFPCGAKQGALKEVDMDFIRAHKLIAESLSSFVTTHLHGESEDGIIKREGKRPNLTGNEAVGNFELERILFTQRWIDDHEKTFKEKDNNNKIQRSKTRTPANMEPIWTEGKPEQRRKTKQRRTRPRGRTN